MRNLGEYLQHIQSSNAYIEDAISKRKITIKDLLSASFERAKMLDFFGAKPESRIVTFIETDIDWFITEFACIILGCTSIHMFETLSDTNIHYQINDCKPDFIIAKDFTLLERIHKIANYSFKKEFVIHDSSESNRFDRSSIISFTSSSSFASHIDSNISAIFEKNIQAIDGNAVTSIIYTSGTGGMPKGVQITHRNLISQVLDTDTCYNEIQSGSVALSFLPNAHIFQRMVSMFYLYKGINIVLLNDSTKIAEYLKAYKPDIITTIPRVLEKIRAGIHKKIENSKFAIRCILHCAYSYAMSDNTSKGLRWQIYNALLYKKILKKMGGNLKYVISGGAPLSNDDYRFFYNIGLPFYQGYGMTECSPVIAANTPKDHKICTVGKKFPSVDVKLGSANELMVRGPNIMLGYLGHEKLGQNEWFSTGDVGQIDKDGFITITGRIKEQFKTSTGKYINPNKLEALINQIAGVELSCIIADGKSFVTCIIFPSDIKNIASMRLEIFNEIEKINLHLDKHEQIHDFYIADTKPSIKNNMITPSIKIRRTEIYRIFAVAINEMYHE